jgi:predicted ATPase/DNA-binding SARP family transcriptional activator
VTVDVRFLGGLEVRSGGAPAPLGGPQAQVVFALLASEAGRTVSTAQLVDELWPTDPPRNALGTIQTHVATIRRGLGSERGRLRTRDGGYVLDLDADRLDVTRFTRLAREGRQLLAVDAGAAQVRLEAALSEWRGEPLVGLAERAPRLQAEATRLRELMLGVSEDLAEARLADGQHTEVAADLERVLAEQPFRERAVSLLLRALAGAGRRSEALRRYLEHRRLLADELGVNPSPELQRSYVELLRADDEQPEVGAAAPTPSGEPRSRAGRLPSFRSRFFGRERDLEELAGLIDRERLITITGVGGGGKTRLGVEVAGRMRAGFPEGVAFVDLSPIRDGDLVTRAIADAVGVLLTPRDGSVHQQIVRAISDGRELLVVDNCEHLLDACTDRVVRLLDDCPNLVVLAISREPLCVDGERRWRLDPLPLPSDDAPDEAASMQLLLDRAQAVRRDLEVTDDNRAALVAICRQLDGLPLALELVAARLEHLSPPEVAARLADHPSAVVRDERRIARHRTLEAAIGWSYDLLSDAEQVLLRKLSVFVGGATLEAVTAVADGSREGTEVLESIGTLVRCSLVTVHELDGTSRYDLLQTVREFAAERLRATGEEDAARLAHRDHHLGVLEDVPWDQRMFSHHLIAPRLDVEFGNLRVAFETSMARAESDVAARLVVGSPALIHYNQRWDELDRWLTSLWGVRPAGLGLPDRVRRAVHPEHHVHHFWLEVWRLPLSGDELAETWSILRAAGERLPASSPARIFTDHLVGVGQLLSGGADLDDELERLHRRAEAADHADAPLLRAVMLEEAALTQALAGRYEDALVTLRSVPVFELATHYSKPLSTLTAVQHLAGDHDGAISTVHRILQAVHPGARSLVLVFLAIVLAGAGDHGAARDVLRRAREEYDLLHWRHPHSINDILVACGACAVLEGRTDVAARLLAAAGSPAEGFKPLTAIHRHYIEAAGPPDLEAELPAPSDTAGCEELVDAELLRWAREDPPVGASSMARVAFVGRGTTS